MLMIEVDVKGRIPESINFDKIIAQANGVGNMDIYSMVWNDTTNVWFGVDTTGGATGGEVSVTNASDPLDHNHVNSDGKMYVLVYFDRSGAASFTDGYIDHVDFTIIFEAFEERTVQSCCVALDQSFSMPAGQNVVFNKSAAGTTTLMMFHKEL